MEEDLETQRVEPSPLDGAVRRRAANLNLKGGDTGTVTVAGENGNARSPEKLSRSASVIWAWRKTAVVPSSALFHVPHSSQAWGIPADAVEPPHHQQLARSGKARGKVATSL